ncbi:hypothetical protein Aiant_01230 [Actinoplanes ianthinogenes]|uniref:NACHT domain-containing protein n=1 Tax=Actinoplanes ianthinogenes TaxID=122358 RepID=A0ABM7LJN6_9ACTN|nr:NACHT domain-containing protein [Actinoplanes ianthinogenes]BCJ39466.1 hypothetical protein Aiant_01230 [Actinoplanes ianthinogenes]
MAFLDTGDKIASIVGAVLALVGLWITIRTGRRRRRRGRDPRIDALRAAQRTDAAQHRYRFFGEHVPALTDLYVRPRASLGGKTRTFQATQMLTEQRHAVLLGDAGAGKSTFLATVAGDLARRGGREVAVIVPAADLVGRPLPQAIAQAVRRDLGVELPPEVFERAPARGGAWRVLVDGLDEVVGGQDRSDALWRIRELLGGTGPYRLLITSRPLAAPELAGLNVAGTGVYDLRPFDRPELNEFAHRWFAARFPSDRRRADATAGRFLARLAGARLGPVARVPLLATIAALVYEQEDDRALPSSRAELYERFVQHLLDGRGSMARFREAIEPELAGRGRSGSAVAEWLFADLHQHVGGLLRDCGAAWLADRDARLISVAAAWFRANGPDDLSRVTPGADRLLRELLLATGVCAVRGDRVVFLHQSFAEYFAAAGVSFDRDTWLAQAADPVTRSLAAFVAARRPDADALVAELEPIAAGDLIADGVQVSAPTRERTVAALVRELREETAQAPEALRILGELSLDAAVLREMLELFRDPDVSDWVRAMVADRIADVDLATGITLLEEVATTADEVVHAWITDVLAERGLPEPPVTRHIDREQKLGALARHALTRRLSDARATEVERLAAARQLAEAGDRTPLRAMAAAADTDAFQRLAVAAALADVGEPELLRDLGSGAAGSAPAMYAAAADLADRGDPAARDALAAVARTHPDYPMAFAAAARCADLGDREPLTGLARRPGQIHVRLAAARRLAALGDRRALGWLLEDRPNPHLEALAVAGLLEAGQAEQAPRMRTLLRGNRVSDDREREFQYLLAANGDDQARELLHRRMLRRSRWWKSADAAIALAAIGDRRGTAWLHQVAGDPNRYGPARVRAATGLTWLDPDSGWPVLRALTGPDVEPPLRLEAARAALIVRESADPLAGIAFDAQAPAESRAKALDSLIPLDLDPGLRRRLAELAFAGDAPVRVRLAAAPLLPEEEMRAVLAPIVAGEPDRRARIAAIELLDSIDRQAAGAAFGAVLRDRRYSRLRRWALVSSSGELLSAADARVMEDRLGDPDDGIVRFLFRMLRLLPRDPAAVLGGATAAGAGASASAADVPAPPGR